MIIWLYHLTQISTIGVISFLFWNYGLKKDLTERHNLREDKQ